MLDPQESRFGQSAILSGLMDAEGVMACWEAIPSSKRGAPEHIDRRLARQAVQSQALTLWQAQQILAGRTSGFQVDRYTLLELIGQGGMGRVYLARDTRLNRRVALKILAPERINNPRAVARFHREARVGAQLQHEHLVRVYDFGESSGRHYLVMEYIEGRTIGSLLSEQGPMPPATAARLVRQVAGGLAHAHRKGLIHRDVNPYNIMVTHEGIAKLADLGLAIDLADSDRVTRDGATVGTFDYVAPEQARHSHLADIRSDIYSLGCTLYHMLSGQVPFPSPSLPEKLFSHQAIEPTPIEQLVPGLPPGMAEVVGTMMRKQPEERYATPAQVVQALEPFIDDESPGGRGESDRAAEARSGEVPIEPPSLLPASDGGGERPSPSVTSGSGAHGALTPGSPVLVGEPVLASAPEPAAAAARAMPAGAARPGVAAPAALADARRSPNADLDDANLPMLTPTDEVGVEGTGLPIVLDLGTEPLMGTPSRSRRSSDSRAARSGNAPAAASSAAPGLATARAGRPAWSSWVNGSMAAAAFIAAVLVVLALSGRLGPKRSRPPAAPPKAATIATTGKTGPSSHVAPPTAVVFVGSHRKDAFDDEGDVPARSLAEAVKSAMGRGAGREGYVELRNREPLRLEPSDFVDVRTASGTLEILAAPGLQAPPVIEVPMDAGRPFLATGSNVSLRLSGLTIRARYSSAKPAAPLRPMIECAGRARIERCAFEVIGHQRPDGCRALFMDGGGLDLDRCWIEGFDEAIRVRAYGTTVTRISRSMIVPVPGSAAATGPTPELRGWPLGVELLPSSGPRRLTLEHCTFEGIGLLEVTGQAGAVPLPVDVKQCAVRADALLAWSPPKPGDPLKVDLLWQGLGNQYQVLGRSWVLPAPRAAASAPPPPGVSDAPAWARFVAKESGPIESRILYRTLPDARSNPPRPEDFAIESTEPPAVRAGADPAVIGPWGK